MAGKIVASTINDDTGVLATQNGMTGIAKAWVNFNGTGTPAIRGSFNVSSITDNGTGDYTINFTTAMPNTNYSFVASFANTAGILIIKGATGGVYSTTALNLITVNTSSSNVDVDVLNVAIFSS